MIELMFTGLSTALIAISSVFGVGHAQAKIAPSASASVAAHGSAQLSDNESASSTLAADADSVAAITSHAAANLVGHLSLPGLSLGAHARGNAALDSNE